MAQSFANQNLRGRSFRGQDLSGADFSGCDLRGCDFSNTELSGASFHKARIGYGPERVGQAVAIVAVTTILSFDALSTLIFASMGLSPANPAYGYTLALIGLLAIAGAAIMANQSQCQIAGAIATGALLGFFYVGTAANKQPQAALAGALAGGTVAGIALGRWRTPLLIAVMAAGTVAAYGFVFWAGTQASNLLHAQRWPLGMAWAALCLLYGGLTLKGLTNIAQQIRRWAKTNFQGAALTGAIF